MKGHILLFALLWLFYAMLTGFEPAEFLIGAFLSLIISFVAHYSFMHGKRTGYIKGFFGLAALIPYYIHAEVISHMKVLSMIITGRINPGFVEIPVSHKNEWGIAMLSNLITMTPGTLTVDADNGKLLIHCLDKKMKKKDIAEGIDHFLKQVWD